MLHECTFTQSPRVPANRYAGNVIETTPTSFHEAESNRVEDTFQANEYSIHQSQDAELRQAALRYKATSATFGGVGGGAVYQDEASANLPGGWDRNVQSNGVNAYSNGHPQGSEFRPKVVIKHRVKVVAPAPKPVVQTRTEPSGPSATRGGRPQRPAQVSHPTAAKSAATLVPTPTEKPKAVTLPKMTPAEIAKASEQFQPFQLRLIAEGIDKIDSLGYHTRADLLREALSDGSLYDLVKNPLNVGFTNPITKSVGVTMDYVQDRGNLYQQKAAVTGLLFHESTHALTQSRAELVLSGTHAYGMQNPRSEWALESPVYRAEREFLTKWAAAETDPKMQKPIERQKAAVQRHIDRLDKRLQNYEQQPIPGSW